MRLGADVRWCVVGLLAASGCIGGELDDDEGLSSSGALTGSSITVYQNCSYTGYGVGLGAGSYTQAQLLALGVKPKDISSAQVASGYMLTLYSGDNFTGTQLKVSASDSCFIANSFNDTALSVVVTAPAPSVTVYQNCSYTGYAVGLSAGSYTQAQLLALGVKPKDISSAQVASGYTLTLYSGDNFTGTQLKVTASDSCFIANSFNDTALSVGVAPTPIPPTNASFIFRDDFESTPVISNDPATGYTNWDETCCAWSFTNSTSVARTGTKAGRFELRKSDPSPQPNDSRRAQMEWNGLAVPTGATWYAISVMPDAANAVDPAPEDLFDLHDRMPGGAPSNWTNPFGVWNKNGRWTAHVTYDTTDISTDGGRNIVNEEYDLGPVTPGKWVDWILHTNYTWAATGYVELYKDGVKVVDYKGPCAYKGAMPDPYFKFGIYKWPWAVANFSPASTTNVRVFYFDHLRIGGNANSLNDFLIP